MFELFLRGPYFLCAVALFFSLWIAKRSRRKRESLPLPPGPPGNWAFTARDATSRVIHTHLQPKVSATYGVIQHRHARNLILDVLDDPVNHQMHTKRYAASVIMAINYGKTTPTAYTDPEVVALNLCQERFNRAARPGAYLVDSYPILKYVPFYARTLRKWHKDELALFRSQVDIVKEKMASGDTTSSLTRYLLENQENEGLNDDELAYIAGSMFSAGSDTTAAAISFMIMSAALHPQAQARVQEELDTVIGRDRMPTFADWDMLPQTLAFMSENFRWRPIVPGGFPHCATKDVIWNGYLIPAGTAVVANHWSIAQDPDVFPDPDRFDPQRWIDAQGKIRRDIEFCTYGFGRRLFCVLSRVCPGRYLADRSLFVNTALMLWSFRISEDPAFPLDPLAFPDTVLVHPDRFKVIFEPRVNEETLRRLCTI
ncbi:hypothetical protein ID866_8716 [Astraeus odoratus]|nr:hypothetical protein ID866_8716 [Astraeus odoratus]